MMDEDDWENPFSVAEVPLLIEPEPPEQAPKPALIVLGRFQPFHRGHAALVEAALDYANENGLNSRLDEIQSSILNLKMKYVNSYISQRNKLANLYLKYLKMLI